MTTGIFINESNIINSSEPITEPITEPIIKKNLKFHARFSAKEREYEYVILNRNALPVLDKNKVWHLRSKLDINLLKKSFKILLDQELPSSDRDQIKAIALTHPEVLGFHDLRTRDAGRNYVIQFHLELDPQMSLLHSHEIIEEVMEKVIDAFPDAEIIVHSDPLGVDEERDPFE